MEKAIYFLVLTVAFIGASNANSNSPLQLEEVRGFPFSSSSDSKAAPHKAPREVSPYRLPTALLPQAYSLRIRPILDDGEGEWTAPGQINMTVVCVNTTNKIVFHRHQTLNISETSVQITGGPSNGVIEVESHGYEEQYHFHTITLKSNLSSSETYTISIDFTANISATTDGLYRAFYVDDTNVTHRMATTQFESYSAREAFPCFDEPDLKATFQIAIGRTDKYKSLSNSGLNYTDANANLPGWQWDVYNSTVKMSTYLVALIVSEFEIELEPTGIFDKPVKVYGAPHLIRDGGGKYAATASANIIKFLETKYNHTYDMDKIDSAAIPTNYFGAGAMENWGLNTYKENYLLFFEGQQGWSNKLSIASILSHELAHQWFGNLVTCNWWSQLWLNEGFATYVSFVAVSEVFPEFREYMREMLWDTVQNALAYDVGRNQPLVNSANSLEELDTIFNTVTYDKGGSIIRMMEGFLGEATLTNGLQNYLEENALKGAEQDALFEALNTQAAKDGVQLPGNKTVKDIMDTWTLQSGYPLIRVSKVSSSRIYISQEVFGAAPGLAQTFANQLWEVPIATLTPTSTGNQLVSRTWLSKNQFLTSYIHDTSKWILLNPDATGFYRVLYDDDLGNLLTNELKANRSVISALSRSQLIDDYFNLAKYKYITMEKALSMSKFIKNDQDTENDHVVWYTLFTSLSKALTIFQSQNSGSQHSLANYLRPIIETALNAKGWQQPDDDAGAGTSVLFRAKLLDWACALESEICFKQEATRYFADWTAAPTQNPIPVDIQPVMYCAITAQGGEAEFEFILNRFEEVEMETSIFKVQRARLLNALACTQDDALILFLLEEILDESSKIGKNRANIVTVLQRLSANSRGRSHVLNFIDNNFGRIKNRTEGISAFSSVVSTLASYQSSVGDVVSLQNFIEKKKVDLGDSLDRYISTINSNIEWVNDFYGGMNTWFINNLTV